jgi:hypothetical protein
MQDRKPVELSDFAVRREILRPDLVGTQNDPVLIRSLGWGGFEDFADDFAGAAFARGRDTEALLV